MKDRNETSSNLAWQLLDGSVSFERNDTCNWKNISIKTKEPTWFSFVSSSPIDGLLLVSKTNPPTYILITDDDYSLGPSPNTKDLKLQFQGAWLNDLTSKEVDAALASAKQECFKPSGEIVFLKFTFESLFGVLNKIFIWLT